MAPVDEGRGVNDEAFHQLAALLDMDEDLGSCPAAAYARGSLHALRHALKAAHAHNGAA